PIYLYAKAALRPERERLPDIRKGEFEGLRERIGTDPAADPDFGPRRIHPTAGATAVGARPFLVAFNIYLDTADVGVAKEIAKRIRTSSGGLPAVQASGFEVGGRAQVSMNLLDIDTTPPAAAYGAVEAEAHARDFAVVQSEVVGLVPERAILGAGAAALRLAEEVLIEADRLRGELRRLVDADAAAYAKVSAAYGIPKDDPSRGRAIDAGLVGAAQPPVEVARRAVRLVMLAREIAEIGNKNA